MDADPPVRDAGPFHRRPGRAGGPRAGLRPRQVGPDRGSRARAWRVHRPRQPHAAPAARRPGVALSAETGRGLDRLMPAVFKAHDDWCTKLKTRDLNDWLKMAVERHPPPAVNGQRVRPKYMAQIKARPPTFVLFASRADQLPESYKRYLVNSAPGELRPARHAHPRQRQVGQEPVHGGRRSRRRARPAQHQEVRRRGAGQGRRFGQEEGGRA